MYAYSRDRDKYIIIYIYNMHICYQVDIVRAENLVSPLIIINNPQIANLSPGL